MAEGLHREFGYRGSHITDVLKGALEEKIGTAHGNSGYQALDDALTHGVSLGSAYYMEVSDPKKEGHPVVGRYFSSEAATVMSAPEGNLEWRADNLYVNDTLVPRKDHILITSGNFDDVSGYRQVEDWMNPDILGEKRFNFEPSGRTKNDKTSS